MEQGFPYDVDSVHSLDTILLIDVTYQCFSILFTDIVVLRPSVEPMRYSMKMRHREAQQMQVLLQRTRRRNLAGQKSNVNSPPLLAAEPRFATQA